MSTDPQLLLDRIEPPAQQILFVLFAATFGLVLGMAIGITLMSDLLTTLGD